MSSTVLAPNVQQMRRVAMVVQITRGVAVGCSLYTWGPLFFDSISHSRDPGLGITLTTLLISLQNILRALLEIPTGAIGDAIGRKWTVIWSLFCFMLYNVLLAYVPFAHSLPWIMAIGILSVIVYVLYYTLFSGTFTAWCVDSLRASAPHLGYEYVLGPTYTAQFIANTIGGIIGITLYVQDLAHIAYILAAGFALLGVIYCIGEMESERSLEFLNLTKVSVKTLTTRMGQIVGAGFQLFRRSPPILILVLIFSSFMTVLNLVAYLWPVYVNTSVPGASQLWYWAGLATATSLSSSLGSHSMTWLTQRSNRLASSRMNTNRLRRLLIGACFISAVPVIILSWLTAHDLENFGLFAATVLLVHLGYGVVAPSFETLVNNYIPETHASERATIMSLGSVGRSLLTMLLAIPAGGPSGMKTMVGWIFPATVLLVVAVIGNWVLRRAQQRAPDVLLENREDL